MNVPAAIEFEWTGDKKVERFGCGPTYLARLRQPCLGSELQALIGANVTLPDGRRTIVIGVESKRNPCTGEVMKDIALVVYEP